MNDNHELPVDIDELAALLLDPDAPAATLTEISPETYMGKFWQWDILHLNGVDRVDVDTHDRLVDLDGLMANLDRVIEGWRMDGLPVEVWSNQLDVLRQTDPGIAVGDLRTQRLQIRARRAEVTARVTDRDWDLLGLTSQIDGFSFGIELAHMSRQHPDITLIGIPTVGRVRIDVSSGLWPDPRHVLGVQMSARHQRWRLTGRVGPQPPVVGPTVPVWRRRP